MKRKIRKLMGLAIMASVLFVSCGGSGNGNQASDQDSSQKNENGLTTFEQKNGIGPVTEEITLSDTIEKALAHKGEGLFETKCSACHKLDERYVGPAQRDLVERRSPEYIMNMMLNPDEMVKKHPEAKQMLAEFMTPMPNQGLSREEARAIVEYFRYMNKHRDLNEVE